jgi:hypothetical protein
MPAPRLSPADRPVSLAERAQRLREKMIATALLDLEDWSTPKPVFPSTSDDAEDRSPPSPRFDPPPIRWLPADDSAA